MLRKIHMQTVECEKENIRPPLPTVPYALSQEFSVPNKFAADFAEELYLWFLSGIPIGLALLATRRSFWKMQYNHLGIVYVLYSSLAIRIAI